jgi:hypothetical protein
VLDELEPEAIGEADGVSVGESGGGGETSHRPSAKPRLVGCVGGGLRRMVNLVPSASGPPTSLYALATGAHQP